ncbi:MAG TPA: DUF1572 family protein [Verrucomicrobiae bacterium]|jgi:hypothetical protein|nr:DUF1572 family protein [Verrucomicrobiae bacterium]
MPNESYIQLAVREFERLKKLAESAMSQVSAAQFFAAESDADNSIAVIVKHVGGNSLSRWTDFLTSDGEKPGRNRDREFEIIAGDTRESLMSQWDAGWAALFSALKPLTDSDLSRTVTIRGEPLSVLQAINRQLTHYAYHVGQIVYVARHHAGGSWRSLSIPKGKSAEFNARPAKYVDPQKSS